ncbi:unnamed protein product, partial [Owenia fusiformis]
KMEETLLENNLQKESSFSAEDELIDRIKRAEYPRSLDLTYLDHSGATLYSKSHIEKHHQDLLQNVYGNPHSSNPSSKLTSDTIDQIRYRILQYLRTNDKEYSVIFTSGCTAALKLVAESFQYSQKTGQAEEVTKSTQVKLTQEHGVAKSTHDYGQNDTTNDTSISHVDSNSAFKSEDRDKECNAFKYGVFSCIDTSHTSVVGMRELAIHNGASFVCLSESSIQSNLNQTMKGNMGPKSIGDNTTAKYGNNLFVYPAQCNFSGRKYPLSWIKDIQDGRLGAVSSGKWYCLLDAASFLTTSTLDLSEHKPDFVTLSFYKIFGFPTGIGALLVKNASEHVLQRRYFGGGTVNVALTDQRFHNMRKNISDRFEDGTVSFLDIIALRHGFDTLNMFTGSTNVPKHTFHLAWYTYTVLSNLRHSNQCPVARLYCDTEYRDVTTQGPIVNFNLLRPNGEYIGFAEVDKLAQLYDIHLRTGCFCNTGACQKHLALSDQTIKDNFQAGHVCGDDRDIVNGLPTGSIRVSFGYMSTLKDAQTLIKFIVECFVDGHGDIAQLTALNTNQCPCHNSPNHDHNLNQNLSSKHALDWDYAIGSNHTPSPHDDLGPESTKAAADQSNSCGDNAVTLAVKTNSCDDSTNDITVTVEANSCNDNDVTLTDIKQGHMQTPNVALPEVPKEIGTVHQISVYPVKSCAAFQVASWNICSTGLVYDRQWMVVNASGACISQKREARLSLIKPTIDLERGLLSLNYKDMTSIDVTLQYHGNTTTDASLCHSKVCGDRVSGVDCGDEVASWLSRVLNQDGCRLIRQSQSESRVCKLRPDDSGSKMSLANESQYLLINLSSCRELQNEVARMGNCIIDLDNLVERFRANIIVDSPTGYVEDTWTHVTLGTHSFKSMGQCSRCQMVCVDQSSAERSREPLKTLAVTRGKKIPFGIHLSNSSDTTGVLSVGDTITHQ